MTLPTLDARSRVKSRLDDLGMTSLALAKLANMPASRITLGLRGLGDWSEQDSRVLLDLTLALSEIRDSFLPLLLDMGQPEALSRLLNHMKENEITPGDVRLLVSQIFRKKE